MYQPPSAFLHDEQELPCGKCGGSGHYYFKDHTTQHPHFDICYACRGRGVQTINDAYRCQTYWNKYARIQP